MFFVMLKSIVWWCSSVVMLVFLIVMLYMFLSCDVERILRMGKRWRSLMRVSRMDVVVFMNFSVGE